MLKRSEPGAAAKPAVAMLMVVRTHCGKESEGTVHRDSPSFSSGKASPVRPVGTLESRQ